jgi:hypothetical protein
MASEMHEVVMKEEITYQIYLILWLLIEAEDQVTPNPYLISRVRAKHHEILFECPELRAMRGQIDRAMIYRVERQFLAPRQARLRHYKRTIKACVWGEDPLAAMIA